MMYVLIIFFVFCFPDAETTDISSEERDKVTSLGNRMTLDDDHFLHSRNSNLSNRRRSAPGLVNVSLLYPPSAVASDGDDMMIHQHNQHSPSKTPPRARVSSPHQMGYHQQDYPGWISPRRARGRHGSPIRATPGDESPLLGRSKRSMSLPLPDAPLIEVGEAVGAIASDSPEHSTTLLKVPIGKRGRCMSTEESSLDAILEDGGMTPRVNTVRRLSVPTHSVVTQMNS